MSKERELLEECQFMLNNKLDYISWAALLKRIRELLAQPEPEPVAWMYDWEDTIQKVSMEDRMTKIRSMIERPEAFNVRPLYTVPPKREPLSDEEIFAIGYKAGFAIDSIERDLALDYGFLDEDGDVDNEPYFKLVRAIEEAHSIGEGYE